MAYYNNIPNLYPSAVPYGNNNQMNNGITWVQGEQAAKAYPVAAGQSILLLDSEASTFYIKSVDQSGMPGPLRIFDFVERKEDPQPKQEPIYITKEEFEEFKNNILSQLKTNNGYKPQYKKKEE